MTGIGRRCRPSVSELSGTTSTVSAVLSAPLAELEITTQGLSLPSPLSRSARRISTLPGSKHGLGPAITEPAPVVPLRRAHQGLLAEQALLQAPQGFVHGFAEGDGRLFTEPAHQLGLHPHCDALLGHETRSKSDQGIVKRHAPLTVGPFWYDLAGATD